jgi:hypothetical protein
MFLISRGNLFINSYFFVFLLNIWKNSKQRKKTYVTRVKIEKSLPRKYIYIHYLSQCDFNGFYFTTWFVALSLMHRLQKLLVEQELAELGSVAVDHLAECRNLSGQVTLSLVLFLEEFTGEVVDKLVEKMELERKFRVKVQLTHVVMVHFIIFAVFDELTNALGDGDLHLEGVLKGD